MIINLECILSGRNILLKHFNVGVIIMRNKALMAERTKKRAATNPVRNSGRSKHFVQHLEQHISCQDQ